MGSVFLEVCPAGQYPSETELLILHVLLFSEGVRLHSLSPPPFPIHGEPQYATGIQLIQLSFGE